MVFELQRQEMGKMRSCLNPCYTGKWFLSYATSEFLGEFMLSLNPCYTGKWFLRKLRSSLTNFQQTVLILVILENGF